MSRQLSLKLPSWGGKRRGAGAKPKGRRPLVSHDRRPALSRSTPVHVTLRMRPEIRDLRKEHTYRAIAGALRAGGERFGLRVVHHSVQSTHIHLITEAQDATALSRGMQGLSIRIAKRLNAYARRRGKVLADRYHAHQLRTPRETRLALLYVLNNGRKHGAAVGRWYRPTWIDPYSSAGAFDGWATKVAVGAVNPEDTPPWRPPRVWLLRVGWRRHGLLPPAAVPSARA